MSDTKLRIADCIQDSIVDGPGMRLTVFTQGCPHHCSGCHNPQTWSPEGGKEISVDEIIKKLISNPLTDGVTLSGGEPYFQAAACAEIAERAHAEGYNVWCYSGYTYEEITEKSKTDEAFARLLSSTDVLVDGPFVAAEKSLTLKWRGSRNQRVIDVPKSMAAGSVVLNDNR